MDLDESDPDAFVAGIVQRIMQLLGPRAMSRRAVRIFSMDVVMIGLRIRIGYLLDISCNDPTKRYGDLISALREEYPIFEDVLHLYEPTSDQSFIVNVTMLRHHLQGVSNGIPGTESLPKAFPTEFVTLKTGSYCESTLDPPPGLPGVLSHILFASQQLPNSITLPTNLTLETQVPLAAVLLEYSVGYIPAAGSSPPYLCGEPLTVYEAIIRFNSTSPLHSLTVEGEHRLFKFSIPKWIAEHENNRCNSQLREQFLLHEFTERVKRAFKGAVYELKIHTNVVLNNGVAI